MLSGLLPHLVLSPGARDKWVKGGRMAGTLTVTAAPLHSCRSRAGRPGAPRLGPGRRRADGRPAKHPAPSRGSLGHPAGCYSPWRRRRRRQCWRDRRDRSRRGCWGAGSSWAAAAAARRAAHPRCWSRGCSPEPSWCRHRRGAQTWGCGAEGGRLGKPSAAHRAGGTPPRRRAKGAARSGASLGPAPAARGWGLPAHGSSGKKSLNPGENSRKGTGKRKSEPKTSRVPNYRVPAACGRGLAGVPRTGPARPLPRRWHCGSGATRASAVPLVGETLTVCS